MKLPYKKILDWYDFHFVLIKYLQLDLRTDLAELYIKLKAFEDAKRVLIDALKFLKN